MNTQPFGQTGQVQATIECGFTLKRVRDMTIPINVLEHSPLYLFCPIVETKKKVSHF